MNRIDPVLAGIPAAKLVLHLVTHRGYGIFRDELYYLACADHLAWGYVDHPPLSVFVLWLVKAMLGDSLLAVRFVPALAGAATVLVSGLMVRRLGGGRIAQAIAMLAVALAPMYLALHHIYSMNALDVLVWTTASYFVVRLLQDPTRRDWIALGVVLGLGLLNKISVLWLGLGLTAGLLATRRSLLATVGPWITFAVAAVVALPHLVWQVANEWPTAEFIANATRVKMVEVDLASFVSRQVLAMNPAMLPLWTSGLVWLLFARTGRYRALAVAYLAVFALLVLNGTSRASYLGPAYTFLFAGGGMAMESLFRRWRPRVLTAATIACIVLFGALSAPFGLPVLPVPTYVSYAKALGIAPSTEEHKELAELPQFYADMHGWEAIVEAVAQAYRSLTPQEQEHATVFAYNYGVAGAVDHLGRRLGLPKAVSGHNNYWLWGPRGHDGRVVIVVGNTRDELLQSFESVEAAAVTDCGYCMPYENGNTVWVCRGLKVSVADMWSTVRHYD